MALKLEHIFPGIAVRPGEVERDAFVDSDTGRISKRHERGVPRLR
jgi:hypothetical protein